MLAEKLKTVVPKAAKRKRGNDSDDEYLALSDDEDGFYDRTAGTGGAKKGEAFCCWCPIAVLAMSMHCTSLLFLVIMEPVVQ